MKRALAMALGAMMVAGSAAPASAASHIDFSGYYRINYIVDNNRNFTNEKDSFTDHYFDDRLQVNLTFRPTDEIAVHWAFRGPNRDRWGTGTGKNMATRHVYGEIVQDWGTVLVGRIADDFDTYGLGSLGYMPGFGPFMNVSPFDDGAVVDGIRYNKTWDNGFGIMTGYSKKGVDKNEWTGEHVVNAAGNPKRSGKNGYSDTDWDVYRAEASYQWDGGGATLGLAYERDARNGQGFGFGDPDRTNFLAPTDPSKDWYDYTGAAYDYDKKTAFYVNPAIMHTWDNGFGIHFEGMFGWGEYQNVKDWKDWTNKTRAHADVDADGYGFYLDFDYNYGPGNVNLAGWWVSGSDLGDTEDGGLVDFGENFYPMLVAYGGMASGTTTTNTRIRSTENTYSGISAIGFANNGYENYIMPGFINGRITGANLGFLSTTGVAPVGSVHDYLVVAQDTNKAGNVIGGQRTLFDNGEANHWAIALTGNHAFTDDITMHYGVAYLSLVNPNYKVMDKLTITNTAVLNAANSTVSYKEQDKDLGFEMDLGFRFQLLDNLSFNTSFGYMIAGDAYKQLRGYTFNGGAAAGDTATVKAKWEDGDDSYIWYNTLQFDF